MEDRKRPPISTAEDLAPPSKRHQSVNGSKSKGDSGDHAEEHWIEPRSTLADYDRLAWNGLSIRR
ncbi:hypothetical protein COL516b_007700 [Colletotrichum fioriniae]|nr:uncharacterized protein COL516b_007700 [Colletotrichum fioriniae]KAJ0301723.1 hypothetical protein COL516b_007700 [Colletotrichum fioriniae]